MTTHRRDRFPLSVSVITATGVSAVWPALTAEDIVARRIAFAVMLVLLALAIFILGVQMWGWVRGIESRIRFLAWRVDERLETLSRRAGDLDCQMDSMMSLVRHSRAHRGRLPAAELLLEVEDPPDRMPAPPSREQVMPGGEVDRPRFPWVRRVMRDHPGVASAAAAGVLVAAGAAGVAVLLTTPEPNRHPAGVPEAIRPHSPAPTGPATAPPPSGSPSTSPPTTTVTVTVAAAIPHQGRIHGEYVGVPVAARSQPAPSPEPSSSEPTTVSGTPAAGQDEPCLIELGDQCGVTSTLIGP